MKALKRVESIAVCCITVLNPKSFCFFWSILIHQFSIISLGSWRGRMISWNYILDLHLYGWGGWQDNRKRKTCKGGSLKLYHRLPICSDHYLLLLDKTGCCAVVMAMSATPTSLINEKFQHWTFLHVLLAIKAKGKGPLTKGRQKDHGPCRLYGSPNQQNLHTFVSIGSD